MGKHQLPNRLGLMALTNVIIGELLSIMWKSLHVVHTKNGEGLGCLVRIVGGANGKALLLFPEARSPSHLVEEKRIICTMCGILSIWLLS